MMLPLNDYVNGSELRNTYQLLCKGSSLIQIPMKKQMKLIQTQYFLLNAK